MRLRFSDLRKLKQKAKEEVESGLAKLKNWWVGKYKLPWNHELFQSRSIGGLNLEMYEDLYLRKEELEDELENASGKEYTEISKRLNAIYRALDTDNDEGYEDDPLIAKWERELEEGKAPDLEEKG